MNHSELLLRQSLGTLSPSTRQRLHNEFLIDSLTHQKCISFSYAKHYDADADADADAGIDGPLSGRPPGKPDAIAHQAGVNCLTVDGIEGQYLFSGGADSTVRMWDLETNELDSYDLPSSNHFRAGYIYSYNATSQTSPSRRERLYKPKATLSRSTPSSHTHALTSISIYPFDPTPSTLLTTSYDKTLKVSSITSSTITPLHTFPLDYTPYTHALSPLSASSPLIAVGTTHPAIRLLDLRSGLSTHSVPGGNGAVYTLAWSPRNEHTLAAGFSDGRVLFFDIRRANAAFAALDLDDAVGVLGPPAHESHGHDTRREPLSYSTTAHAGPVTSVQWTPSGDKLVTAGHDQRIRVWDTATGRTELVHFGPRIRNERLGQLGPLISPPGTCLPGRESLFWPNDDSRGLVFQHSLREGVLKRVLKTEGVKLAQVQAASSASLRGAGRGRGRGRGGADGGGSGTSSSATASRVTGSGRINAMVWRVNPTGRDGAPVEMYTAHGDGRIGAWLPGGAQDADEEEAAAAKDADPAASRFSQPGGLHSGTTGDAKPLDTDDEVEREAENRRKRKRALIGDLVQGLAKRPISFS
ncbi:hypothetical protein LTR84_004376 [Exophiala bonariae]|uniref:Anaphase-promoting complex subunit 4 WD40 domain-containing protein n=1 Tax=Exophiala bonariae TaxID=1690606 RepID=A0AAV9N8Y9_9EURO|nr:hypothetical protein LTR84_004376 [Exophiala bonariae]